MKGYVLPIVLTILLVLLDVALKQSVKIPAPGFTGIR